MNRATNVLAKSIMSKTRSFLTLQTFKEKLLQKKINSFQPKVVFLEDHKNYRVMTASFPQDLEKILKLRHKIFVDDLGRKAQNLEVDFDRYDLMGDHIMIIDRTKDKVIGTYRVISSQFADTFYSENEFHIDELKARPEAKVELGRACIHSDYRNGITLHLIWRGLARYVQLTDSRYLFGCSSIFETEPEKVQDVLHQFSNDQWGDEFDIRPTNKYRFPNTKFDLTSKKDADPKSVKKIPPLLMGYLKAGAKIYGEPALDAPFYCSDLFTILDMEKITPQYHNKYFV